MTKIYLVISLFSLITAMFTTYIEGMRKFSVSQEETLFSDL